MIYMQFVIAGSYAEYNDFIRRKQLPQSVTINYIFISDPMRLYGRKDVTVLSVGHYQESPVYQHHALSNHVTFIGEDGKPITPPSL